ncbi:MAG: RNA methyltransferase [Phenylobacterium sp. RIFCSPHIGHO2_01_FULL_69_31]|uniref:TrmH family RNA methyltransferase n=1 Tax=Phenylobacterium sp. RIFCSPHIGHO2_01_FULL_69_31 TaxID=1801944 RepID=UPI0008D48E5D|nr:RNA methyltransferase [Phenylobacterium sp. RIFCSPHIGHO2_01_FULL_69_31]OHB27895.1 MAG: RNA methyltransferase [Phenylobacterium sp. RIFCSPHIGHO2_01_FULL_69_31]
MPTIVRIRDAGDPRLEVYRAVRERDLAGREGLFVAEGRVVLEKAVAAMPEAIASVLVTDARLESLAEILAGLPAGTPVYAAGQGAMDEVVGFPIHRGILAVGRRPDRDPATLLAGMPPEALVVGLVGIANHDNMGGIFRNAAAFGAAAVLLDDTCCDPLYRKAIRVSVGAALTVPFARAGTAAALMAGLGRAGFETLALSPRGAVELADLRRPPKAAVLFGAEGPGLPEAVLAEARGVRIAMAGGFDSLNVATTSGIVLHHLAAQRNRPV